MSDCTVQLLFLQELGLGHVAINAMYIFVQTHAKGCRVIRMESKSVVSSAFELQRKEQ